MILTGGCRCGVVRYRVETAVLPAVYACHCLHCQTSSGSAFALNSLLPEDALSVESGEPLAAHVSQRDGVESRHYACAVCHTRLYNTTSAAPGMRVLRAGTLEQSMTLSPMAHIWTRRKQAWLTLAEDVPRWPENPTPEAFGEALAHYHATLSSVAAP